MKKGKWLSRLMTLAAVVLLATNAHAASVLLASNSGYLDYGYGHSNWTFFTNALNAATGNQVTKADDFSDLAQMMQYDAIFLDQRWPSGILTETEEDNIKAFISTGRKVVLMGESSTETAWNNQILGLVGGSQVSGWTGPAFAGAPTELTAGVFVTLVDSAGVAAGGTALFDQNWATLWGENVLTLLDVNAFSNAMWGTGNNAQFALNVAAWLADSTATPIPGAAWLLGSGLAGLIALRRRMQS